MEAGSVAPSDASYESLIGQISATYQDGQASASRAVNVQLIQTYWRIGQHIVEFEQAGQQRAVYGKGLIDTLAKDLSLLHGKGFGRSNLIRFRQFYQAYPKGATASHFLSWSHIVEFLKIDDLMERELAAPVSKPWGQTVSYVRCPDGALVELCSPISAP
jgi:hypothetical protein